MNICIAFIVYSISFCAFYNYAGESVQKRDDQEKLNEQDLEAIDKHLQQLWLRHFDEDPMDLPPEYILNIFLTRHMRRDDRRNIYHAYHKKPFYLIKNLAKNLAEKRFDPKNIGNSINCSLKKHDKYLIYAKFEHPTACQVELNKQRLLLRVQIETALIDGFIWLASQAKDSLKKSE